MSHSDCALSASATVDGLPGVGEATLAKLHKAGLFQLQDFWFFLPRQYQDKTRLNSLSEAQVGDEVQLLLHVKQARIQYGRQRSLLIATEDDTGRSVALRFFHFGKNLLDQLRPETRLLVYGTLSLSGGLPTLLHPEFRILKTDEVLTLPASLTPIYPNVAGLGQARLRQWTQLALTALTSTSDEQLQDFSPDFLSQQGLSDLKTALGYLHQPPVGSHLEQLQHENNPHLARLIYDELLAKQLGLLQKREAYQNYLAPSIELSTDLQHQFLAQLPFALTKAQTRVIDEIFTDLQRSTPMHRLLQGDVGSGKTIVALCSALQAIAEGHQVALMAPTEILSEQHAAEAQQLLSGLSIHCVNLTSKLKAAEKRQILEQIKSGQAQLIIGTHALFQEAVTYYRLGLVIIDEQHRFGVHQRLLLRAKTQQQASTPAVVASESHLPRLPHLLIMTATPIPRTLTMSFYADLDTSIIDELPPHRKTIETRLLPDSKREELLQRLRHVVQAGQQVYWVCALIDESETLSAKAAQTQFESLQAALPELRIGLLHGRLSGAEKMVVMQDFIANKCSILVATTVIEVGVNVPNASLMVIENSERFGLSQLHQLRGRVGRGAAQSYCILLYQNPLSNSARERLQVIRNSGDGFAIAQADLKIRGAGEVLGTRQTGEVLFRIADMTRDAAKIETAYHWAKQLLVKNPRLAESIVNRWLGEDSSYWHV